MRGASFSATNDFRFIGIEQKYSVPNPNLAQPNRRMLSYSFALGGRV